MIRTGFDQYGPRQDPAWQRALDRIAPRTPYGHDHLRLVWEAGDHWAPVNRWVIYQMTPRQRVPFGILDELEGPNPRNFGYYDKAKGAFVRSKTLRINLQQWLLFQKTGYYGRPLWVIQGSSGGHLRRFSDVQSAISEMHGGPVDPPAPGDLPYAELDERTIAKLRFMDVVSKYGDVLRTYGMSDFGVRLAHAELSRREREMMRTMAEQLWDWMGSQVEEAMNPGTGDGLSRAAAQSFWENTIDDDGERPDYEAEEEEFKQEVALDYAAL